MRGKRDGEEERRGVKRERGRERERININREDGLRRMEKVGGRTVVHKRTWRKVEEEQQQQHKQAHEEPSRVSPKV